MQPDILYGVDAYLIALVLLALMVGAMMLGHRIGIWHSRTITPESRDHANALQPSFLTLIALLLAFTFALALDRFAVRSTAVVTEANTIGTAWLRTELLPEPARTEAQDLMRSYLQVRLAGGSQSAVNHEAREAALAEAAVVATRLWTLAAEAARAGGPVPLSFAHSVNEMIDAFALTDQAVRHHVPQTVLLVLFASLIVQGLVYGYCGGIGGARPTPLVYMGLYLTAMAVFLILDLDRPRRGLITVDRSAMYALADTMGLPSP
jgi:hypothetical protein